MSSERIHSLPAIYTIAALAVGLFGGAAQGEPIQHIVVDGSFADWNVVPSHLEFVNDENEDYHDAPPPPLSENPQYPDHPDVDILEYQICSR